MTWLPLAILASALWGLGYVVQEKAFEFIDVKTYLVIVSFFATIVFGSLCAIEGNLFSNLRHVFSSKQITIWMAAGVLIYILAELCIGLSINQKNATLAGMVEISYPLFIAIFSLLILKQNHFGVSTIIGGILIFLGVGLVSFAHR